MAGAVSGGLEILDIDTIDVVEPWATQVYRLAPALLDRLVMVESPRPGLHIYYRCPTIGGSEKLAVRADSIPNWIAQDEDPNQTKGEGGYCLVPPSPAACHSTFRQYKFVGDRDLTCVPTITPADRDVAAGRPASERATHPPRAGAVCGLLWWQVSLARRVLPDQIARFMIRSTVVPARR